MAKKKKKEQEKEKEKEQYTGPQCPICQEKLQQTKIYNCPHCKHEIDYLLVTGKKLTQEEIEDIKKGRREILQANLIAVAGFFTVWILLYWFILSKCLNPFVNS